MIVKNQLSSALVSAAPVSVAPSSSPVSATPVSAAPVSVAPSSAPVCFFDYTWYTLHTVSLNYLPIDLKIYLRILHHLQKHYYLL